jgi:hypothetical protein
MEIHYLAIVVASLLQFVFGAIWYTPVFGKVWGRIHGFDKVSKEKQREMMKSMGPYLALQLAVTVLTTYVLALLLAGTESAWSAYALAGLCWIGFFVPAHISAVVFGGTEPRWMVTKISIMAGASFGCMMIAAAVLSVM